MKPNHISIAILLTSPFLVSSVWAQTPAPGNQSAAAPAPTAATGEVPRMIKFSGTLMDEQGQALKGPLGVTFALYAQQTGGGALWLETQNVKPDASGNYTVLLGANTASGVPAELFVSGEARWLGIQVGQQPEHERILLVSVPYALKAGDAETLGGLPASAFVTTGAAASSAGVGAPTPSAPGKTQTATGASAKTSATPQPATPCSSVTSDGTAAANSIGLFTTACNIESSLMSQATINGFPGVNVAGNNAGLLLNGTGTHQVTVTGATSGRLGQDANGFFFASDTKNASVRFLTNNGSLNEWMRITSAGNVGIHTQTPTTPLDVNGNVHSSGTVSGTQLVSTVPGGTPPLTVTSSTQVPNLNASFLGNMPPGAFALVGAPNTFTANQLFGLATFSGNNSSQILHAQQNGISTTPGTFSSAVWGEAVPTGGNVIGVSGTTVSTAGIGVMGESQNSIGNGIGVFGRTDSSAGIAGLFHNIPGGNILVARTGSVGATSDVFTVNGNGDVNTTGTITSKSAALADATGGTPILTVTQKAIGPTLVLNSQSLSGGVFGNIVDAQFSGSSVFRVDAQGIVTANSYRDLATGKNVGLLLTCMPNQIMQWTGTAWACSGTGTVTSVSSGLGLTGGPITGSGTLAINPAVVPQLTASSNTFTGSITASVFTGNLNGNATTATSFTGSLAGEVTGTQGATVVSNAVTANTAGAIVRRDSTGNFSAGAITLSGNLGLPNTNGAGSAGVVTLGGIPFLHNFGTNNTFVGTSAGNMSMTGLGRNTAVGANALGSDSAGCNNAAFGFDSLASTTGNSNSAFGSVALFRFTSGGNNSAFGFDALDSLTSGDLNTAIGSGAGGLLTTGHSNIYIANSGAVSENNTIRIGTPGTGSLGTQTKAFIAGISGTTTGGVAVPVLVDVNGQLGTTSSSRRFKYDIQDMGEASSDLLRLRPVTFRYKQAQNDGSHPLQYGLIAEEVAEVYPELVQRAPSGEVTTVLYHLLPAMLLNELQKQQRTIQQQQAEIEDLTTRLAKLEVLITPKP